MKKFVPTDIVFTEKELSSANCQNHVKIDDDIFEVTAQFRTSRTSAVHFRKYFRQPVESTFSNKHNFNTKLRFFLKFLFKILTYTLDCSVDNFVGLKSLKNELLSTRTKNIFPLLKN